MLLDLLYDRNEREENKSILLHGQNESLASNNMIEIEISDPVVYRAHSWESIKHAPMLATPNSAEGGQFEM